MSTTFDVSSQKYLSTQMASYYRDIGEIKFESTFTVPVVDPFSGIGKFKYFYFVKLSGFCNQVRLINIHYFCFSFLLLVKSVTYVLLFLMGTDFSVLVLVIVCLGYS